MLGLSRKSLNPNPLKFGPFNSNLQKRWKKPVDSAQTRLENRALDPKLDKLIIDKKQLKAVLKLHSLMSKSQRGYASVQRISRWRNILGIKTKIGDFLRKYPQIFDIYTHPVRRNVCCRVSPELDELVSEEARVLEESTDEIVLKLKKLLMMTGDGALHMHALGLVRHELGLPNDFRSSIVERHTDQFRVVGPDTVLLVGADESPAEAAVEKWRERECLEKWLSEHDTEFAFPVHFPTGFKFDKGFKEMLRNWQRLPYVKPYERTGGGGGGASERYEKWAVGMLHEFLSLTVEKLVEVERLAHFRRDFKMDVNVREVLLKHPGIFYVSTRGGVQTVILREAYSKGCLIEASPLYLVRAKMSRLVQLGALNPRQTLQPLE